MAYERSKEEAVKFFSEHQFIHCPAFPHEKVYFNSKGLNHMFYKGDNRARTHEEILVRVGLLDRALELLKIMPLSQEEDFIFREGKKIIFWAFEGVVRNKRIKVIIRQRGTGKKLFWSVIPSWRKSKFGERRNSKSNLSGE